MSKVPTRSELEASDFVTEFSKQLAEKTSDPLIEGLQKLADECDMGGSDIVLVPREEAFAILAEVTRLRALLDETDERLAIVDAALAHSDMVLASVNGALNGAELNDFQLSIPMVRHAADLRSALVAKEAELQTVGHDLDSAMSSFRALQATIATRDIEDE